MSALTSASGSRTRGLSLTPTVALAAVVTATLVARLVFSALAPLTEDEAYYRLWSLRPAFGYFDHPPMIAWWIWLGRHIVGDNAVGVRLLPSLGTALTSLAVFDLAREAGFSDRIAARAGIWLNATLLIGLGGAMAVPDVPNALFWTLALCAAFRAVRGHGAWWLAAGAAAGLACLSKYSALFLGPGVLIWLVMTAEGRKSLRTPCPWLAAVLAAAVFAPNVLWNADHGWLTFIKQFGRVRGAGFKPGYLAKLALDQFMLLNPLIALFVGLAVRRRVAWPLLVIGAPFVAYLIVHSLHDAVQGQWPAPLYPLAVIAAAAAAEGATGWLGRLRTAAPWAGFAISAAALVFIILPSDGGLPMRDPGASFRDWPGFFAAVERARSQSGAAWVGAPTYGIAAQLASSPRIHAPAVEIFERERATFETPAERADFSKPGLVVVPGRGTGEPTLKLCFADVKPLPEIDRGEGRGLSSYAAYLVSRPLDDVERAGCYRPSGSKF
jgi:4-amino-4-deoxy-L-arabinose transferase-like glycosyltransferase